MKRLRAQRFLAAAGLSLVTGTAAIVLAITGVGPLGDVAASVRAAGAAVSRGVLSVVLPGEEAPAAEVEADAPRDEHADSPQAPPETGHEDAGPPPQDGTITETQDDGVPQDDHGLIGPAPSTVTAEDPGAGSGGLPQVDSVLADRARANSSSAGGDDSGADDAARAAEELTAGVLR